MQSNLKTTMYGKLRIPLISIRLPLVIPVIGQHLFKHYPAHIVTRRMSQCTNIKLEIGIISIHFIVGWMIQHMERNKQKVAPVNWLIRENYIVIMTNKTSIPITIINGVVGLPIGVTKKLRVQRTEK